MPVAIAGHRPATFEIKSASLSLLSLRLKTSDMQALATDIEAHSDLHDFFDDDLVVVDLSALPGAGADGALDFPRLIELLEALHLHPVGARGGSAEAMRAAAGAGLPDAPELREHHREQPAPQAAGAAPAPDSPGALVVDHPIRSGQQVYARGRDLVINAMVNPGAEVIADGHVHVWAPLRGRAIAGARGWAGARIFAHDMRPQLISVAGVYRTSEHPFPESIWGRPASVALQSTDEGDRLILMPVVS